MKIHTLKIEEDEGFLGAEYTFVLEKKKLKQDDAEEKILLFEELVDELYEGTNKFKTKFIGKYVEIKESSNSAALANIDGTCKSKNLPEGLLCSSIKYSPKKSFFKKATITVYNGGNNPLKIGYFNNKIKNLELETSSHVSDQIKKLDEIVEKYK